MAEKFISVKIFRGTMPEDGGFAGGPGACFRVASEDDAHVKFFHVTEPPFNVDHLEDPDRIKAWIFAYMMFPGMADTEVKLAGAKLVAEYKMTEAENLGTKIERIK